MSSPALRARVVAEAPAARPVPWSDRVWFSRTFRWSVTAAFVALIAIGARDRQQPLAVTAEADMVRTVAIEAGLSEDAATSLARRAMNAQGPSTRMPLQQLDETRGGHE
jgi:hypothetical protein